MHLDQRNYSAAVIDKIVTANAYSKSGKQAKTILEKLAELFVSVPTIMDLSNVIGRELHEHMQRNAHDHAAGELKPQHPEVPACAVVTVDGGRIQTRLPGSMRGIFEQAWNETKNGCFQTMTSQLFDVDPHPELPTCFQHQPYVEQILREIKAISGTSESDGCEEANIEGVKITGDGEDDWRPKRLVRTCLSSMCNSDEFGPLLAAEAQRRGFYDAAQKAYLGDGQAWNWTLQKRHFSDFEAIVDFVHPLTYLYEAACVIAPKNYWQVFLNAATDCWQGRADEVITALRQWMDKNPWLHAEAPSDKEPQVIVQATLTYLQNNAPRMNYPSYRQRGLPVTSAMVESMIKEINYRVKGSEKFWNRPERAEAILQVRAAALCDDDRLSQWIKKRPGAVFARPATECRVDGAVAV